MQDLAVKTNKRSLEWSEANVFSIIAAILFVGSLIGAGSSPLWFTIVTVVLFGAPHNWSEFRYFLSKLPSRFSPVRSFFLTSFIGVALLFAFEVAVMVLLHFKTITPAFSQVMLMLWNELIIFWMMALYMFRYRKKEPHTVLLNLFLMVPATVANILAPQMFTIVLTYLHTLVAFWILERELKRTRKSWLKSYHTCMWMIPIAVLVLAIWLNGSTNTVIGGQISSNFTNNIGIFNDASSTTFLAIYGFLQMMHYGIWIIAMPIATQGWRRWQLQKLPVLRNRMSWRPWIAGAIGAGTLLVLGFWFGFKFDYANTNEIYITLATLHVLAEIPFMFWMCES